MFICTPCREKETRNGQSYTRSYGRCDLCNEQTDCEEISPDHLDMVDRRPLFVPAHLDTLSPGSVLGALRQALRGDAWARLTETRHRPQTVLVEAADGPVVWDTPSGHEVRRLMTPYGALSFFEDDALKLRRLATSHWSDTLVTKSGKTCLFPHPQGEPERFITAQNGLLIPLKCVTTFISVDGPPGLKHLCAVTPLHQHLLAQVPAGKAPAVLGALMGSGARIVDIHRL